MKRILLPFVILLAGCADYVDRPIDPAGQAAALESRRLDSPDIRHFFQRILGHDVDVWPLKTWDLNALTLAAYYYHPDLDRALAQRLTAEAAMLTAGQSPNPVFGGSIQHSENPPGGESPWIDTLGVDIPIETAGKRDDRLDIARHRARAAALREADAVWQVRSHVRDRLLDDYPTDGVIGRQRDLQADIAQILERRFADGYASQPEVTTAWLELNRGALALREIQKRLAENRARLAAAVGIPLPALDGAALSFDSFNQLPPISALPTAETRTRALRNRPDVLAALADYEASQAALRLEIAKQYPDISLGPGYVWNQGQLMWSLALSVALPVLNRNEGPIAEAAASREQAAASFLAVQSQAIAEMDEALAGYAGAIQVLDTADGLLGDQRKKERSVTAAFQLGEADRLSVISSRYETATAELARIDALVSAQRSLGRLEDAIRRPIGSGTLAVTTQQVMSMRPRLQGGEP